MAVNLPPILVSALDVIAPDADNLFKDEQIAPSCCFACFSTKLGPNVTEAIKTETQTLGQMVEYIRNNTTGNSSRGPVSNCNAQLSKMITKYQESQKRALGTIKYHQDMDRVNRCIGSRFCSSPNVKAAHARNTHITSHLEQLQSLQKNAKGVEKKFTDSVSRLEERSLKAPKIQDTELGKLSLNQLKKSTVSLMANTVVKVESSEVKLFTNVLKKINKLFEIETADDSIRATAKLFSTEEGKVPSTVEETRTLHALKFCSLEAYAHTVRTLNDCLIQKCQGKMASELNYKGKFTEISIEERSSGAVAVTSLAPVVLTASSENRQICTVDATLEAIIHSKEKVELSCTFDNIELAKTALLSDMTDLEKVFS